MTMPQSVRKFTLTAHIVFSVGWLGAVAAFFVLALIGLTSRDWPVVRAAYVGMESITWWTIVPLSFASLLTGLTVSLGTRWGLFHH